MAACLLKLYILFLLNHQIGFDQKILFDNNKSLRVRVIEGTGNDSKERLGGITSNRQLVFVAAESSYQLSSDNHFCKNHQQIHCDDNKSSCPVSISFCLQRPTDPRLAKGGDVSNDCLASPHLSKHFSARTTQVKRQI